MMTGSETGQQQYELTTIVILPCSLGGVHRRDIPGSLEVVYLYLYIYIYIVIIKSVVLYEDGWTPFHIIRLWIK